MNPTPTTLEDRYSLAVFETLPKIADGWKSTGKFRAPKAGETYLAPYRNIKAVIHASVDYATGGEYLIVERKSE